MFRFSEKVERELVSSDDSIVVYGNWNELDVLLFKAAAIKIHLDNAVKEGFIGCLHFSTSASLFLEVQFNKLIVLQEGVNVTIDHCLIQLIVCVIRV